jgi:hypothetical protein
MTNAQWAIDWSIVSASQHGIQVPRYTDAHVRGPAVSTAAPGCRLERCLAVAATELRNRSELIGADVPLHVDAHLHGRQEVREEPDDIQRALLRHRRARCNRRWTRGEGREARGLGEGGSSAGTTSDHNGTWIRIPHYHRKCNGEKHGWDGRAAEGDTEAAMRLRLGLRLRLRVRVRVRERVGEGVRVRVTVRVRVRVRARLRE